MAIVRVDNPNRYSHDKQILDWSQLDVGDRVATVSYGRMDERITLLTVTRLTPTQIVCKDHVGRESRFRIKDGRKVAAGGFGDELLPVDGSRVVSGLQAEAVDRMQAAVRELVKATRRSYDEKVALCTRIAELASQCASRLGELEATRYNG